MNAIMPTLLVLLIGATLLAQDPRVEDDPVYSEVVVWDEKATAPKQDPPPHDWYADVTAEPPATYSSEPLYCRKEAPFPQDECIPPPEPSEAAEPAEADAPAVTPGDVVEAVRRVGLPRLSVAVQPAGSTLVNLDTIFYTSARPFERTVPILGSTVDLRATPATYTWHHGDDTTQTTSRPGRPYPALDVTHRYRDPDTVAARVDVTYRVTYRINGGEWQDLGTTITAEGPATTLRVREARPVLTD